MFFALTSTSLFTHSFIPSFIQLLTSTALAGPLFQAQGVKKMH